ncbi:MAG TPA: TetR family transcriptional regulator, partial [Devosia sp.]|nr:TetR family transcriptional regulator [Devosia sp.]
MTIDRRRQILDAALSAFLERGYAATSIADIRARSGASTGSIYHFFAG